MTFVILHSSDKRKAIEYDSFSIVKEMRYVTNSKRQVSVNEKQMDSHISPAQTSATHK